MRFVWGSIYASFGDAAMKKSDDTVSRSFYVAVSLIFAAFAAYELVINLLLRAENDRLTSLAESECLKPVYVPPVSSSAVFWFAASEATGDASAAR